MKDHLVAGRSQSAPADAAPRTRGLVRLLYTSNPFYVMSADLIFVGLRVSFDTHGGTFETGALMLGLALYTLLLATTAYLLIRFGKVWDDARSLLLLVVLMFLAMSVTFDDTLARSPRLGVACYVGGLLFAAAASEALLRGIRLALPAGFRVPYYLILALFFLYPIALVPFLDQPDSPALQWTLFGFSPLAGVVFLSLLPAIRRGSRYVAENGSPWRWPLYPWVLFGFLGVAVCARSYYLCVSLHFVERSASNVSRSSSIFGPYFLAPFLLAVGVLLLELGLVARNRMVLRTALAAPLGLLTLSLAGNPSDVVSRRFLTLFLDGLGGSPLFLALLATIGFYAYASLRRVPMASWALALSLTGWSVIGPGTLDLDSLVAPRAWPIALAAALQGGLAMFQRDSRRAVLAAACFVAALAIGLPDHWPLEERGLLALQLAMVSLLAIGALFDDAVGALSRSAGAVLLFVSCAMAMFAEPARSTELPAEIAWIYPPFLIAVAIIYGCVFKDTQYYVAAIAALACWLAAAGWRAYNHLRGLVAGLDLIASGLGFFLLAALISLKKAGVLPKRFAWRSSDNEL